MILNYKEYTQAHQRQNGYDSDTVSRFVIRQMLEGYGCTDIQDSIGNVSYDLIATLPDGSKAAFEIKDREINSTKYNDHMIESIKLQSLIKRKQNGEFDHIHLISIFEDSVIFLTKDIDTTQYTVSNKPCPTTTKLANNEVIMKQCNVYKPTCIRYLEINIKDRVEHFHFSDKPFTSEQENHPLF